jgi:hypothetical protein
MLANARAFLLLAADLTVTRARLKRNGVLAGNKDSTSLPGLPATLNPQPSGRTHVPGEPAVATGPGRRHQPGITGPVFTETRTRTYPRFTCSLSEKPAVPFSDNQCGWLMPSAVQCGPVQFKEVRVAAP